MKLLDEENEDVKDVSEEKRELRQVCLGLSLLLKRGQKYPTKVNNHFINKSFSGGMVGDLEDSSSDSLTSTCFRQNFNCEILIVSSLVLGI